VGRRPCLYAENQHNIEEARQYFDKAAAIWPLVAGFTGVAHARNRIIGPCRGQLLRQALGLEDCGGTFDRPVERRAAERLA